jgi:hypothetical protein
MVDKGAIKFVFGGANVMNPGMTHETVLENNQALKLEVGDPVVREPAFFLKQLSLTCIFIVPLKISLCWCILFRRLYGRQYTVITKKCAWQ